VIAAPGWQTQVFVLQTDYGASPGRSAAPTWRTPPCSCHARVSTQATNRCAWPSWRAWPGQEPPGLFQRSLRPVGGKIRSSHAGDLRPAPDAAQSELRPSAGRARDEQPARPARSSPDVEALALALDLGDPGYTFSSPPTLRESWNLVLNASASASELVPARSLAGEWPGGCGVKAHG